MAQLLADENFPLPVVNVLRHLGHDVLTIQETGQDNQSLSDESVLKYAHSENRMVITLNRKHFIRLHQEGKKHSGIIVCSLDVDFPALAQRIHDQLSNTHGDHRPLIRVNRPST